MAISVKISWKWINWSPGDKWVKHILPQLENCNINVMDLQKCVYVIKFKNTFTIKYGDKFSPTLYIGEGNFKGRLIQHSKWLVKLNDLVNDFDFKIGICIPKYRNLGGIHKDLEAELLHEFKREFKNCPLINQQMEYSTGRYKFYPQDKLREAILISKGFRYYWALEPMKNLEIYKQYLKGSEFY